MEGEGTTQRASGGLLAQRVRPGLREELPDQIALLIAAAIRAGRYPGGRRLPSVRRLAGALGVHRDTARGAYGRLAREGWVRVRPGSGVYVAPGLARTGTAPRGPEPDGSVRRLLLRARAEGVSAETLAATLERWSRSLRRRSVLVVGPDPATARVWAAELEADLAAPGVEVRHVAPEGRCGDGRLPECTVVAAPPGLLGAVAGRLATGSELVALRPGPGPELARLLREVPSGTVLAVVSASACIRSEVSRFAAVLRGGEVAVVEAAPDGEEVQGALSVARFVLVDVCSRRRVSELPRRSEGRCFRHLDPSTARMLADYFDPAPAPEGRR